MQHIRIPTNPNHNHSNTQLHNVRWLNNMFIMHRPLRGHTPPGGPHQGTAGPGPKEWPLLERSPPGPSVRVLHATTDRTDKYPSKHTVLGTSDVCWAGWSCRKTSWTILGMSSRVKGVDDAPLPFYSVEASVVTSGVALLSIERLAVCWEGSVVEAWPLLPVSANVSVLPPSPRPFVPVSTNVSVWGQSRPVAVPVETDSDSLSRKFLQLVSVWGRFFFLGGIVVRCLSLATRFHTFPERNFLWRMRVIIPKYCQPSPMITTDGEYIATH